VIRRILVLLDGSAGAECVLTHVVRVARVFGSGVDLLSVICSDESAGSGPSDPLAFRFAQSDRTGYLRRKQAELRVHGIRTQIRIESGDPAEEAVALLQTGGYDLVALTSHGRGHRAHLRMGRTAMAVVLNACTSFLLAPGDWVEAESLDDGTSEAPEGGWILAPVDCSPRSDWTVSVAAAMARGLKSKVRLVHIVEKPKFLRRLPATKSVDLLVHRVMEENRVVARKYVEDAVRRLRGEGISAEGQLLEASVSTADRLTDLATSEEPDLIVLGAHGQGGSPQWLFGGTAIKLIFRVQSPILVLQDFRGPVDPSRVTFVASRLAQPRRPQQRRWDMPV